jgi:excisionase family DNA binding protein
MLLKPREVAAQLGVSVLTLRRLIANGAIEYVMIGNSNSRPRKAFTQTQVDDFLQSRVRRKSPMPDPPHSKRVRSRQSHESDFMRQWREHMKKKKGKPG